MPRTSGLSAPLLVAAGLLALLLLLLASRPAAAEEVTRASYTAAVEPICRSDTKANERILAGVRKEVRVGKLKSTAARFRRAAKALSQTWHELAAVPRPRADEVRLQAWLGDIVGEINLFEATAEKLKAGDKPGAEKIVTKLTQNADKANLQVLPFEFHYCRLEPSRFT